MRFLIVLLVASVKLVFSNTCVRHKGHCVNWKNYNCLGKYQEGWCPGSSNIKCCKPCNTASEDFERSYRDLKCTSTGGMCKHNSNYCKGSYRSGLCHGSSRRQCCLKQSTGSCELQTYKASRISGFNGLVVRVDPHFVESLDKLNQFALSCDVKIIVTNAFRKQGQKLNGAVVKPATHSNHLVGHAIDFNLITKHGWCNSQCLQAKNNPAAKCFINHVVRSGLRWGGLFRQRDPVHIDDNYYNLNKAMWNNLFQKLQVNCNK